MPALQRESVGNPFLVFSTLEREEGDGADIVEHFNQWKMIEM